MKKLLLFFGIALCSALLSLVVTGCEDLSTAEYREEVPTYSVSFMNGDNEIFKIHVYRNDTVDPILATPAEGYDFVDWLLDDRVYDFNSPVRTNIVLTATFKAIEYNISFCTADSNVDSQSFTVETFDQIVVPNVPLKEGYTGSWEEFTLSCDNLVVNAVYTPIVYQAKFYCGPTLVDTVDYTIETTTLEEPKVLPLANQAGSWQEYTLKIGGIEVQAIYSPIQSYIDFYAGETLVERVAYTLEDTITEPEVPSRTGYIGSWEEYTLDGSSMIVNAVYTPKEYSVSFVAGEEVVGVCKYTIENREITPPKVPAKNGYTGSWGAYTLDLEDITVYATYTKITYSTYYYVGNELVDTVQYTIEDIDEVEIPSVPEKPGYSGSWQNSLSFDSREITAVYTLIEYTATFIVDDEIYTTIKFNVENMGDFVEPEAPEKSGYTGGWESYSLSLSNITINAVYTKNPTSYNIIFINGQNRTQTTVTNLGEINMPELSERAGHTAEWVLTQEDNTYTYTATYTLIEYTATFIVDDEKYTTKTFTAKTMVSFTPPEVPAKLGYSGTWQEFTLDFSDITIVAVYTPITYVAKFVVDNVPIAKPEFTIEDMNITVPDIPQKDWYTAAWENYTLELSDITINAVYTPIEYTATFVAGETTTIVNYNINTKDSIDIPDVHRKDGYSGVWEDYTLTDSNIIINAIYTRNPIYYTVILVNGQDTTTSKVENLSEVKLPELSIKAGYTGEWVLTQNGNTYTYTATYTLIEYTATFIVDDEKYTTKTFTAKTMVSFTPPEVPAKIGYNAAWQEFTLDFSDITISAVYTPTIYVAKFVVDNVPIAKPEFTIEDMDIKVPDVPQKDWYTAAWENYTLGLSDITINAIYTPIEYTATFVGYGTTKSVKFNINTKDSIEIPDVPTKDGFTGVWEDYTLTNSNITINAIYTEIEAEVTYLDYEEVEGGLAVSKLLDPTITDIKVPSKVNGKDVVAIKGSTFMNNTTIIRVSIPASVLKIGAKAFSGCSSLKTVTLAEGLVEIEEKAFYNSGIESIVIPNTVTTIGNMAFYNCKSLANVELGTGINLIEPRAFVNCKSTISIIIPDPDQWYKTTALTDPTKLTSITLTTKLLQNADKSTYFVRVTVN